MVSVSNNVILARYLSQLMWFEKGHLLRVGPIIIVRGYKYAALPGSISVWLSVSS